MIQRSLLSLLSRKLCFAATCVMLVHVVFFLLDMVQSTGVNDFKSKSVDLWTPAVVFKVVIINRLSDNNCVENKLQDTNGYSHLYGNTHYFHKL